jgi:glyoxylase-like metal-dependent hydrolase (beta-lactamase superfamily II)
MLQARIGAFTVTRIEEMLTPGFDPAFLFPAFDPAVYDEDEQLAGDNFRDRASGKLMSSMQSWLVRDGKNVILIDTGCGNGKTREFPAFRRFHQLDLPYLDRLAEAGVRPDDVTHVINTHLHVDHIGWNTRMVEGRWAPTFPRARYVFGAKELAHVQRPTLAREAPETVPAILDSVMPVVEAKRVDTVRDGDEILSGVAFEGIPGHSPGQLAVRLSSDGQSAPPTFRRRAVLGANLSNARMAPLVCSRARISSTWPSNTRTVITADASK